MSHSRTVWYVQPIFGAAESDIGEHTWTSLDGIHVVTCLSPVEDCFRHPRVRHTGTSCRRTVPVKLYQVDVTGVDFEVADSLYSWPFSSGLLPSGLAEIIPTHLPVSVPSVRSRPVTPTMMVRYNLLLKLWFVEKTFWGVNRYDRTTYSTICIYYCLNNNIKIFY